MGRDKLGGWDPPLSGTEDGEEDKDRSKELQTEEAREYEEGREALESSPGQETPGNYYEPLVGVEEYCSSSM